MSKVKIAHLSDLHCDSTEIWEKNILRAINCIAEQKPDLVIVTGDCVHSPEENNFKTLSASFERLYQKFKDDDHKLHIITIPGNHDYYQHGNKIFTSKKKYDLYDKYVSGLCYPGDSAVQVAESFFSLHKIAIFPFDSNNTKRLGFAQGRINQPEIFLKKINDKYKKIASDNDFSYQSCLKIVLTHHHPLPLPTSKEEEKVEPFMLFQNAYQFLDIITDYDINLLLHGHKHVSGIAEYNTLTEGSKPIIVSACASSASTEENEREIKIIDVSTSGICHVSKFTADNSLPVFKHVPSFDVQVTRYSTVRRRRFMNEELFPKPYSSTINDITSKTKLVQIKNDGSADITSYYEGIKWKENVGFQDKVIKEYIRADYGRVFGGSEEFADNRLRSNDNSPVWKHPHFGEFEYTKPDAPEEYSVSIKPRQFSRSNSPGYCLIKYPLINGFAMTSRGLGEKYLSGKHGNLNEEVCSIEVHYPTKYLELTVTFPGQEYFPEHIDINAAKKASLVSSPNINVLNKIYDIHDDETEFLLNNNALRINPEFNQISLRIKYPQPDLLYILRWTLPNNPYLAKLTSAQERKLTALRKTFLDRDSKQVEDFYDQIVKGLGCVFDADGIEFVLLGYDSEDKMLKATRASGSSSNFYSCLPLLVGRGPAGKAFKMGSAEYYEKGFGFKDEDGNPLTHVEVVYEGFDPMAVLSIPLMYPKLVENEWNKLKSSGKDGQCPVFAVLSIITNDEDPSFALFRNSSSQAKVSQNSADDTSAQAIAQIYNIISDNFNMVFN
jgi:3',5'-cyclic AMP phosphodiesterase CpdA